MGFLGQGPVWSLPGDTWQMDWQGNGREIMSAASFTDLVAHEGHLIECVTYGRDVAVNAALECRECHTVLMDFDRTGEDRMFMSELADLTHQTQVMIFGWCGCEDGPGVYDDCPRGEGQV